MFNLRLSILACPIGNKDWYNLDKSDVQKMLTMLYGTQIHTTKGDVIDHVTVTPCNLILDVYKNMLHVDIDKYSSVDSILQMFLFFLVI